MFTKYCGLRQLGASFAREACNDYESGMPVKMLLDLAIHQESSADSRLLQYFLRHNGTISSYCGNRSIGSGFSPTY